MEPIRILQEVTSMNTGGVETLLMNIYRNIDREKIQFDFMMHREVGTGFYEDEIKRLGGKIYGGIPFNPLNHRKYLNSIDDFFEKHPEYSIIHAHNAFSMFTLRSAEKHGVRVRIAHSHNTAPKLLHYKTPFKLYAKSKVKKYATDLFACSKLAGEYYYGKKAVNNNQVIIMKNGIDTEKFDFDEEIRRKKREELKIKDQIAIVHVGRFNIQKNHEYLIDIFNELLKISKRYKLFLFGEGDLEASIRKKVEKLGLQNNVEFMGVKGNINEYLQAMDIFILPSLFEGLPLTGIEAQTNGLPCLFSSTITKEVAVTELAEFISIKEDPKIWANKIIETTEKNMKRCGKKEKVDSEGYNIKDTVKKLEEFYIKKYNEGENYAKS